MEQEGQKLGRLTPKTMRLYDTEWDRVAELAGQEDMTVPDWIRSKLLPHLHDTGIPLTNSELRGLLEATMASNVPRTGYRIYGQEKIMDRASRAASNKKSS